MFTFAVRGLAATAAAAALIGAWLYNQVSPTSAADLAALDPHVSRREPGTESHAGRAVRTG